MVVGQIWDTFVALVPLLTLVRPIYRLRCPKRRSELRERFIAGTRPRRLWGTTWLMCRQGCAILYALLNLAALLGMCALGTRVSVGSSTLR